MTQARIERASCCNKFYFKIGYEVQVRTTATGLIFSVFELLYMRGNFWTRKKVAGDRWEGPEPKLNGLPAAMHSRFCTDCRCGPPPWVLLSTYRLLQVEGYFTPRRKKEVLYDMGMTRARIERASCCKVNLTHEAQVRTTTTGLVFLLSELL
jgi:hypothetical protein